MDCLSSGAVKKELLDRMGDEGAVLSGILLGDKSALDPEVKELYQKKRNCSSSGGLGASCVLYRPFDLPDNAKGGSPVF